MSTEKIRLSRAAVMAFGVVLIGSFATASAQDTAAVGSSSSIMFAVGVGLPSQPPIQFNTGQWVNALSASYDATGAGTKGLLINTSAVTAIVTGDAWANGTFLLDWGGLQARVLIDCALPACDATSDTVPGVNLAAPGAIFLDQAVHVLASLGGTSDLNVAIDLAAGARAFNFFRPAIGLSQLHDGNGPNSHAILFQVKFNAGGFGVNSISGALVAIAKRTMVIQAAKLQQQP